MNRALAIHVIEELIEAGVAEFVICSGKRNAPFVNLLSSSSLKYSLWFEERSAGF
jgi:2-succinyl-5-enolpyruvyl-6-hydroxy-3-cyclohexene-1-carboxylate synthase